MMDNRKIVLSCCDISPLVFSIRMTAIVRSPSQRANSVTLLIFTQDDGESLR